MSLTGKATKMDMRNFRILFPLLFLMLVIACRKSDFSSAGPSISVKTILDPFGEVIVNDIFDIEIRNDTLFSIEITGKKSILDKITFIAGENILEFYDGNSYQWLPDYPRPVVTLSFPDNISILLNAPAKIYSADTLRVNNLGINSTGGMADVDITVDAVNILLMTNYTDFGYYRLSGRAENSEILIFGSAQLKAEELLTKNSRVRNYSIGDCHVHASEKLTVLLGHYGNIYYHGSPGEIIIERMESRGRLVKAGP
jgi:hypothetical protein